MSVGSRAAIGPASPADRPAIEALLTAAGLPLDGYDDTQLAVARISGELVGVVAGSTQLAIPMCSSAVAMNRALAATGAGERLPAI